jgi:hypothetical protein
MAANGYPGTPEKGGANARDDQAREQAASGGRSTLRCRAWLMPDTPVVKHSTRCTLADAALGLNAHADQQGGAGDHAERHAERAVDKLCRKADRDEREQVGDACVQVQG